MQAYAEDLNTLASHTDLRISKIAGKYLLCGLQSAFKDLYFPPNDSRLPLSFIESSVKKTRTVPTGLHKAVLWFGIVLILIRIRITGFIPIQIRMPIHPKVLHMLENTCSGKI